MFCKNCGKELEEGWTVCPNCGTEIPIDESEEVDEGSFESDKQFFIALIREHPVRFAMCIPLLLYILYMVWVFISRDTRTMNLWTFVNVGAFIVFCDAALWLLYGPINSKEVYEKVFKKPQKGYGIASHIGSVTLAIVVLTVGNYMIDENNSGGDSATGQLAIDQTASDDVGGDMTIEDYISQCQEVTVEELARNPEQYIGKDIIMEGRFSILSGDITIGWFPENYIIKVNYDKQAVDIQGNVVGDVMSGDYGCVAGRYGGEDMVGHPYIDAAVIVLDTGADVTEGVGGNADEKGNIGSEGISAGNEQEGSDSEYIFPDSDSRYLSEDELYDYDAETLKLARNEIFARHGYIFEDKALQEYFNNTTWYKGTVKGKDFDMESEFNDFEKVNVALIGSIEEWEQ